MLSRVIQLLTCVVLGAIVLTWLGQARWLVALGALAGAALWLLYDNWQADRVVQWLRSDSAERPPRVWGVWAEVVLRTRKNRKWLSRKARKSQVRLNEFLVALKASPNGVILLDRQAQIEWCNFTATQHLGIDAKRDILQPIRNLIRDPAFIAFFNANDHSKTVQIDGRDATPAHPQRIAIHVHPYSKGRRLLLTRDVTALEQAEAMRRDFVANVSHEIRTPLTVVAGFVETLLTLPLTAQQQRHYLQLMQEQTERMQSLVGDLLMLTRLEGSPLPGNTEWVNAQHLLAQTIQEARALAEVLGNGTHQIEVMRGPDLGPDLLIAGIATELLSAMSNLLGNAVRHTPAGTRVQARWFLGADGSAVFEVSDNGPGIAPQHLPRLTERFYRVDQSRSRDTGQTGGTGLGLAIVKHVAQRHGGQLQIDSTLGQGCTFRLSIPAVRVQL